MSEERVLEALRALAENDGSAGASPEAEARLRQKFRSHRKTRARRAAAAWASWAAAAAIGVIFILTSRRHDVVEPARVVASQEAAVVPEPAPPVVQKIAKRVPRPAPKAQEIVTDFFPLMDPAPPLGRGQLLRVELPASAMQMVGLPVREDHLADSVEADVLMGEEGLPRAIRFVSFAVK